MEENPLDLNFSTAFHQLTLYTGININEINEIIIQNFDSGQYKPLIELLEQDILPILTQINNLELAFEYTPLIEHITSIIRDNEEEFINIPDEIEFDDTLFEIIFDLYVSIFILYTLTTYTPEPRMDNPYHNLITSIEDRRRQSLHEIEQERLETRNRMQPNLRSIRTMGEYPIEHIVAKKKITGVTQAQMLEYLRNRERGLQTKFGKKKTKKKTYKGYTLVSIKTSNRSGKKMMALFKHTTTGRTKTTHFGFFGASDYTKHKDPQRKQRYITRHKKRENWNDPMTAGALSLYILWNKPTLKASIADYKKRFF